MGIKQRILAALCGWIPGVNIWYLIKMLRICNAELEFETEKAVADLTEPVCLTRNERIPDAPCVLYKSVMSFCRRAQNGKFPLNVTYPLVKHFDGQNDGLVAVDSARWGSRFTLLEPTGKRGISHGDVVDLNRENIRGYDVIEFYVNLVADLKRRGY